jgi:mannose-6-phosphate isomerase
MLRLKCKAQNYAWGKVGLDSLVGQIHKVNNPEDTDIENKPFAEFWMGDHTNGPSSVLIDTEDANLVSIIEDPEFLKAHDGQEVPIS